MEEICVKIISEYNLSQSSQKYLILSLDAMWLDKNLSKLQTLKICMFEISGPAFR